jgi:hypothetical protein
VFKCFAVKVDALNDIAVTSWFLVEGIWVPSAGHTFRIGDT